MYSTKPIVKRTYGSQRARLNYIPLSAPSDRSSSPPQDEEYLPSSIGIKRKRPLTDVPTNISSPKKKKLVVSKKAKDKEHKKALTQLHFSIDRSVVRSCSLCGLSYTHGALGDESLHKTHCARIRKGMEWGKEEEKERLKASCSVTDVEDGIRLKEGERGRIISINANAGGKLGQKLSTFLATVNEALSAPSLDVETLATSKAYLFLLRPQGSSSSTREKIVGCVVAQRIHTAMEIAPSPPSDPSTTSSESLIHVDGSLFCNPHPLPTALGVARLFVSSEHRRKGIAQALLEATARTFIHGCKLNPEKGEVAFSQPTSLGRSVMEKWGKGGIRIYEECSRTISKK